MDFTDRRFDRFKLGVVGFVRRAFSHVSHLGFLIEWPDCHSCCGPYWHEHHRNAFLKQQIAVGL